MIEWADTNTGIIALCLPEPHGSRLAALLRGRMGLEVVAQESFQPVAGASVYIVTPEDAPRILPHKGGADVAIVFGTRGPSDADRLRYPGAVFLTGALPGTVTDWLESRGVPVESLDLTWAETLHQPAAHQSGAKSVAVYSSGGGVGKSTVSVYLAAVAAAERVPTGLVELDEDRRGILTYFDRKPKNGLDTLQPTDWEDPARFAAAMAATTVAVGARLTVVPMVGTKYGMQYQTSMDTEDHLQHLFDWAGKEFALTVYDLPARVRDHVVLQTLQNASHIILVVEPTEIMVDSTMSYLNLIHSIKGVGPQMVGRMSLLVNKVPRQRRAAIPSRQMADALGVPLLGEVPLDPERYMTAINQHRIQLDPNWKAIYAALDLPHAAGSAKTGTDREKVGLFRRLLGR